MYSKEVIKHFKKPQNQGAIKKPDAVAQEGNPVCGDVMKIYINVKNNKIADIKFETLGCAAAIAVSSKLTTLVKGMTLDQALKLTRQDIVTSLGGLPAPKIHCSMLGVEALHKAIKSYKTNNKIIK